MMHHRHCKHLFVIAVFCGLVGVARFAYQSNANAEPAALSEHIDETYTSTMENRDYRVTLLGVTKGVSFLQTQAPVSDGGRKNGDKPVRWMRVAALVEQLGEKIAATGLRVETADGAELVGKMTVELDGNVTAMRGRGRKSMPLDFAHLAPHIFPVAPMSTEAAQNSKVFVFTLSGDFRPTDNTTLRFQFSTTDERQELRFENVPIP